MKTRTAITAWRTAHLGEHIDLSGADLHGAELQYANLAGADLSGANLSGANLFSAYLTRADLRMTNLSGAKLVGANLSWADLRGANLSGADLRGTDLRGAILDDCDMEGARLPEFQIPQGVDLRVWGKKSDALVEMVVPKEARRTACLISRKCRAEFVRVDKVYNLNGQVFVVNLYGMTLYEDGGITKAHDYNDDTRIDCAPGIHFFLTRQEAEMWFG